MYTDLRVSKQLCAAFEASVASGAVTQVWQPDSQQEEMTLLEAKHRFSFKIVDLAESCTWNSNNPKILT